MNRTRHLGRRLTVALVALAALGAGCSDDAADSSTEDTDTPSTEATGNTTDDTTGTEVSGEPIRVVAILDESEAANLSQPAARAGANARIERINADGGLGGSGRPIEVEFCVTDLDPNTAQECARSAADDPSVVAVVGSVSSNDTSEVLAGAGLANIGALPLSAGDFGSEISFPTVGGLVTGVGGQATLAYHELGLERIANGRVGLETAAQGTGLLDLVLASWGGAPTTNAVDIPPGQADVSAAVSAMAEDADAVVLTVLPEQTQQILLARQQLGIEVPFIASVSNLTDETLDALGDAAEGMHLHAYYPTDDTDVEGIQAYLADLDAIGEADQSGDIAKLTWVAFDLLDHVSQGLDTIDRASVLAALNASSDYDGGGMIPTLDFTTPGPNPLFPRLHNLTLFHAVIEDGRPVAAGEPELLPVFGPES